MKFETENLRMPECVRSKEDVVVSKCNVNDMNSDRCASIFPAGLIVIKRLSLGNEILFLG